MKRHGFAAAGEGPQLPESYLPASRSPASHLPASHLTAKCGGQPDASAAERYPPQVAEAALRYSLGDSVPGADDLDVAERESWPLPHAAPGARTGAAAGAGTGTRRVGTGRVAASDSRRAVPSLEPWSSGEAGRTLRVRPPLAPPRNDGIYYRVCCALKRHLRDFRKPLIIAIADTADGEACQQAIRAYGESQPLREAANLILVAADGAAAERHEEATKPLLLAIDRYDLYGSVALYRPRDAAQETVELLRLARDRRGVLIGDSLPNTTAAESPSRLLQLLARGLGVPVITRDPDALADLCGSVLVDPDSWTDLSRQSRRTAAGRPQPDRLTVRPSRLRPRWMPRTAIA